MIQEKNLFPDKIGQDGFYTVLFNNSKLIPGQTYTIFLTSVAGNYRVSVTINTTLGMVESTLNQTEVYLAV